MATYAKPTFLCIGIQKAGTSWLYRMVDQHPKVCTSNPKELHFFNRHYHKGVNWYLSHFSCDDNTKAAGEFTPDYLWVRDEHKDERGFEATPNIPARVADVCPDAHFIAILRDPVTRAVSSYFHHIGANRVSPNRRLSEVGDQWGILSMGHYADNLERWFEYFPRERFQVLIYEEDLSGDARRETLKRVFTHIGVDSEFQPGQLDERYNKRRSHFDYRLARLSGRLQRLARQYTPGFVKESSFWDIPVSEDEIEELRRYYTPHNRRLAELLKRDMPW
ncbi:sulfotransferase domain-containing protein [Aquisalimonas sp. 2447]|nr:sulfotransferase domain-containing protein [Aquisalimonas sp. 2447]QIT56547.1 sulfotransferase domain-containing protein [Aquisalimonas sp. 2447]